MLDTSDFRQRLENELIGNILPFWMEQAVDRENGGFYGALTNDLQILKDVPRSAVLCARILWTCAAAYRRYGDAAYLATARHAYDTLRRAFWDNEHGGVYWAVDRQARPVNDRKHTYAQAFAIYGLSEYYRATGEAKSLRLAQELSRLIEAHSYDAANGGNIECCSRAWGELADMRLSDKEPDCRKSMNTLLHLLEAYANLLRVWDDGDLRARQRGLIEVFLQHVIDPETHHFRLFFDDRWNSLSQRVSFGHDIEGSWLLVEAMPHPALSLAESTEEGGSEDALTTRVRAAAVEMAQAVYVEALNADGSLTYEAAPGGHTIRDRHWWAHAEAVVGFYNSYQISGRTYFAEASRRCWDYIEAYFVDRAHGDWFKLLDPSGAPYTDHVKVGPWECPYHHARACLEMMARLDASLGLQKCNAPL
jgi:mannobiose 2-epimerase